MSVIFFLCSLSSFSQSKLASDSNGGVHKQYGPKRERGRLFYPMYLMTWFIVCCQAFVHCKKLAADLNGVVTCN